MKTLTINENTYSIPGTWNELAIEQLLYLVQLTNSQISAEEIKLKMLLKTLKARVHSYIGADDKILFIIKIDKHKYTITAEELQPVTDIFDYLFLRKKDTININPLLTKNPVPKIKIKGKEYISAKEGLSDITYEQFVDLMTYFDAMQSNPDKINNFIAILYKTANDKQCTPQIASKLNAYTKTVILWYYIGCLNFIEGKFPRTFSGKSDSTGNRTIIDNQMRVIDILAGNDLTKKETVKKSLLYDALYTMEIAAENAEKLKHRTKR